MIFADRVKETISLTGTGDVTLTGTSPAGYRSFLSVYGTVPVFVPYCITDSVAGTWEIGKGLFNGSVLKRNVLQSSNANALVNFAAGTKEIFVTANADSLDNSQNAAVLYNNANFGGF